MTARRVIAGSRVELRLSALQLNVMGHWATVAVGGRAGCPVTKGLVIQMLLHPSLSLCVLGQNT